MLMLLVNGFIGFHEEWKAQISVDSLRSGMEQRVPTKRDGEFQQIPVVMLVPGDIIFLRGGQIVPADSRWIEGDVLQVDTAALTGEPFPRKIPDDRRGDNTLLSGFIIRQGEGYVKVEKTGLQTEIGKAAALIQEASGPVEGLFESQIYFFTKIVIAITIVDVLIVAWFQIQMRGEGFERTLLVALSITIASVPIALPMVMTITQAIGAQNMAKLKVIVTHLSALQEIASMTVLCSDKTGTLTTAQITIFTDQVKAFGPWTPEDVLMFAAMTANPDNKDDPIDSSITKSVQTFFRDLPALRSRWKIDKTVGFTPIVKRTISYVTEVKTGKKYKLSKGLTSKVLNTGDDGGHETWVVKDHAKMAEAVNFEDDEFGRKGYKTIGVAVAVDGGEWEFVGIIPMLDPPRHDTKETIHKIKCAGVNVKMITGDHTNIAKETAR